MSVPFMPLYIADYLGDTTHLTTLEHGAYLLLLMAMWRAGGTLDRDEKKLARYARMTPAQWDRVRENVLTFFEVDDEDETKITQRRLRFEFQKYVVALEKKSERASLGGKAKALKNNKTSLLEAGSKQALSTPQAVLNSANQNQNQKKNHKKKEISAPKKARDFDNDSSETMNTRERVFIIPTEEIPF